MIFIKLFEIRGKFSCLFLSGLLLAQAVMVKAFTVFFVFFWIGGYFYVVGGIQ